MDTTLNKAVAGLRDAVEALTAEEAKLTAELAGVQAKRKDAEKALTTLSGETPRRRRGRPKRAPAEPVAA